jgi:hypothetical protein
VHAYSKHTHTLAEETETMKFLENEKLTELTAQLSEAILGNSQRQIDGRIEAYTMKRAGSDKKFAHVLGQKYIQDLEEQQQLLASAMIPSSSSLGSKGGETSRKRSNSATSALEAMTQKKSRTGRNRSQSVDLGKLSLSSSGIGDFSELATRRLMTDLILTLNASFPDYDFSSVKPGQFTKLDLEVARKGIYERLAELASYKHQKDWLVELWMAVNDVIYLRECSVYSFQTEDDIFDETLWSFSYFFVNKSLRRVVFFTCSESICESDNEDEEEKISFYPVDNSTGNEESTLDAYMDVLATGGMSIPVPISTI